jgi:hypothetical protein
MTTSDGYIIGTTKVVDHGPASLRYNLVFLGDGYSASEMTKYHNDVRDAIDGIYATAPFNERWCGINVYRVDVVSTDSGIDDPASCSDGSVGSGASVHTYFDATTCGDGTVRRLVTINNASAFAVASAQVPQFHMVFVIVNTSLGGGSGGAVAKFTASSGIECAIHEMGHTAFKLADEYPYYQGCNSGELGHDHYSGGEPTAANVTKDSNATNKWDDLIATTTPTPTTTNADCTKCDTQGNPVAPDTVGTFEGAYYNHCGIFRPQYNCKMRNLGVPFCAVCERAIRQTLAPFQPAEYITLLTPSISFTDIPEGIGGTGITTFRAIVFEIVNYTPKTLNILSGPTSGFGTPFGTSIVVPPPKTTPVNKAQIWLSYTSTTAGATSSGTVTVQCAETGQTWVINISANTVSRPKAAVVLVLDRSGSMIEDAGDGVIKVEKLREAANLFVDAMLEDDSIGIVRFNQAADLLMPVTQAGPEMTGAGRSTAIGHIASSELDPNGTTSIGAGVVTSKQALDASQAGASTPFDVLAQLVLTDGKENTSPYLSQISSSITANTFAIGLGNPENISTAALNALTQGHNGYLLITGTLTSDQEALLKKYFLQILAGITSANVILDPHGNLDPGVEHRIPFNVIESDNGIDVFLLSPVAPIIDFQLETPNGKLVTPSMVGGSSPVKFVSKNNFSYYRIVLPAIHSDPKGSHNGTWKAIIKLDQNKLRSTDVDSSLKKAVRKGHLPYDLIAHCYSNLFFAVKVQQKNFALDTDVWVFASLKEYGVPVEKRAKVWAEVTLPDGSQLELNLEEYAPGQFQGRLRTTLSGLYKLRVRTMGETLYGSQFWREQTLTAAAYFGGDSKPDGQRDNEQRLCKLFRCLIDNEAIDDKMIKQLQRLGFDFKKATKCFEGYCNDSNPIAEDSETKKEAAFKKKVKK